MLRITASDQTLLIMEKIKPKDIGFIHPKQQDAVKISAYDLSIYGGLKGIVKKISADAITEEDNNSQGKNFYLITVRTYKNFLILCVV